MKDLGLSQRIKNLRKQKGMTQESLAENSGLSLRTIQRIENNETTARGDSLKRLAAALNTSPDKILQNESIENEMILADKVANLFRGIESVGGRIKLTTKKLVFKAHAINIQKQEVEIPINNIERIEKKNSLFIIPNILVVILKSGVEYKFVVFGRNKLISLIEAEIK
jgi:transcriptional regulator with XRE-family HTH domain